MENSEQVFSELRNIMFPYSEKLDCKIDTNEELYVDTNHILKNNKPLWFGAVQVKKNYVSYHLMPVYLNPALLDTISPELKKRMQGKSCFNFSSINPQLFRELEELTEMGFKDYESQGYV
jgi:hypothetical protein